MGAFHKAAVEMWTTSSQDEAVSRVRSVEQPFASLHLSPCQFVEPTARRLVRESCLADITQLSATSQQSHIGVIAISPTSSVPTHGLRQLSRRDCIRLRKARVWQSSQSIHLPLSPSPTIPTLDRTRYAQSPKVLAILIFTPSQLFTLGLTSRKKLNGTPMPSASLPL